MGFGNIYVCEVLYMVWVVFLWVVGCILLFWLEWLVEVICVVLVVVIVVGGLSLCDYVWFDGEFGYFLK